MVLCGALLPCEIVNFGAMRLRVGNPKVGFARERTLDLRGGVRAASHLAHSPTRLPEGPSLSTLVRLRIGLRIAVLGEAAAAVRLLTWARRPKTAQALALRSRIVLLCAEGMNNVDVVEELGITIPEPFVWAKTADQILESVARFCKRTSDSGH